MIRNRDYIFYHINKLENYKTWIDDIEGLYKIMQLCFNCSYH